MFDSDIKTIMYVWGVPVTISLNIYLWVMRGETREKRFKRAIMVLNKRKLEGRYF